MKDRFSLHVNDGQPQILEAFTVMRNGFTTSREGLVGITSITHAENQPPIIPETIFNVQSDGQSDIRFSAVGLAKSSIQLLGNGNIKSSGLVITYDPVFTKIDFSSLTPDNCDGIETGFLTVSSNNFVGIGTPKHNDTPKFVPNSPLTIWHSGTPNSGTIALKEQQTSPDATSTFGKIFIKPDLLCNNRQSLFFLDETGEEFNISHPSGAVKTDDNQNTFAGILAPKSSFGCLDNNSLSCNTLYGFAAGYKLNSASKNTLIGCHAGSGIINGNFNTIIGADNFTHHSASNMIVLGYDNFTPSNPIDGENLAVGTAFKNNIFIGTGLAKEFDIPAYTMLIGYGDEPVIEAGLGFASERFLSVNAEGENRARFSVKGDNFRTDITDTLENRDEVWNPINASEIGIIEFRDTQSSLQNKGMASLRFANRFGDSQTLVDFVPSGNIPNPNPSYTLPLSPTPYVSISGDLLVNGCIRFADQSTLCGALDYNLFADSGIDKRVESTRTTFVLDYTNLDFASNITPSIDAGLSYLALEVPSGDERLVGKISIEGLASYVSSGYAAVAENCNFVWSDIESESRIDIVNNSGAVFIGCEVGVESTGWKNSIFIGSQAGAFSTVSNTNLATDTAPIFIGYQAGYDSDDLDNTIAIGTAAGKNADESADSIFIGSSAGLNASGNRNSIGIGENALNGLDTPGHDSLGGNRNIEIVTGLDNDSRLMYSSGHLNDRINIQNVIAGDTHTKMISFGDARISPSIPVESRRDVIYTEHANQDYIHGFFNDNAQVGAVDSSGDYRLKLLSDGGMEAWFGHYEGFMTQGVGAPTSYTNPTSGLMRCQTERNSFGADGLIWVTNRDPKLEIHGPGSDGGAAFVITARVNGENRPMYVSCSGDGS